MMEIKQMWILPDQIQSLEPFISDKLILIIILKDWLNWGISFKPPALPGILKISFYSLWLSKTLSNRVIQNAESIYCWWLFSSMVMVRGNHPNGSGCKSQYVYYSMTMIPGEPIYCRWLFSSIVMVLDHLLKGFRVKTSVWLQIYDHVSIFALCSKFSTLALNWPSTLLLIPLASQGISKIAYIACGWVRLGPR